MILAEHLADEDDVRRFASEAESAVETIRQVIETEPLSPRLLSPSLPRDLKTICLKCLENEPHRRYATAASPADDLRWFETGEPIQGRPIGRTARLLRWCRRKPVAAGLSAAFVLALVAGTVASSDFAVEASVNARHFRGEYRRAEEGASGCACAPVA
jgi:hypothetical protein